MTGLRASFSTEVDCLRLHLEDRPALVSQVLAGVPEAARAYDARARAWLVWAPYRAAALDALRAAVPGLPVRLDPWTARPPVLRGGRR